MKKFKTVLTAIAMLLSVSLFASEPVKVAPVVKAAFQNDFSKASQVKWEKSDDFYFATFKLNDVKVDAAYTLAGELIGTSRRITSEQMPLPVSIAVAERYAGYQIGKSVVELSFEGVTRYYVMVSNADQEFQLKCFSNGDIEVEKRS